ncbi:EF-hand domain-containing protein [Desulfosediminicola flagellatus]|uniref:EF-hand domain-containing protein n=1 Tax=Desulfosediminicola flagellatus TaxID=2569541 RepID=UPI0010AC3CD3|nr:EF-hand domain-containing protein [Desulfosediminicola flagellatus]
MISIINSSNQIMATMRSATQRHPPPPDKDVFKLSDTDSDGQVSATELETLTNEIEELTGNTIQADEALSEFDADQNGSLSGEELLDLLTGNGFSPPLQMLNGENGETGSQPPPPPDQVLASYAVNSGDDLILLLIDRLQQSGVSEENLGGINIIT